MLIGSLLGAANARNDVDVEVVNRQWNEIRENLQPSNARTSVLARLGRRSWPRAGLEITGGYARASYASGGGGASRVPRIAGDVTAGSAHVSCVLVSYTPCAERRRF